MPEHDRRSPYPGLRPFEAAEADLFFGRERQVEGLLQRLSGSHFVAVVGESGSGKSSLVRAGLLPTLDAGFVVEAGSDWRVAVMRPGGFPLEALTDALLAPGVLTADGGSPRPDFALAELRRGPLGLAQLIADAHLPQSCNVLLVVDQFEELFRYCREPAQKDQASIFVELLLRAAEQRRVSISVVLTMRSDFVGDCARFRGLPEKLNDNQFLTPRLTRDEVAEAIRGPARVCGGRVDAELVDELCNAVGDNQDQLPLLQHLLMRVWERAIKESDPPRLTRELASEMGGLYSALSKHAQQIYDSLPGEASRDIARAMFRSLTDPFSQRRDLRRDASVAQVAGIAGVKPSDVIAVAEEFRADGRHMLMPPSVVPLDPDIRLDISHESLIRQWSTLNNWAAEESANAHELLRLCEEASRDLKDRELLTGRTLSRALDWLKQAQPTPAWAERYAPAEALAPTLAFIEESENREKERRAEEIRRLQQAAVAKRQKVLVGIIAIMAVLGVAAFGFAVYRRAKTAEAESRRQQELRALASSRQLAGDATLALAGNPELAVLLANEAVSLAPQDERPVQSLRDAIAGYVPSLPMEEDVSVNKRKHPVPGTAKNIYLISSISPASISSTADLLAVPSDNHATLLSPSTGKVLRTLDGRKRITDRGKDGIIGSSILSSDGSKAVTTGSDRGAERGVALVWDTSKGEIIKDFSPDFKRAINGAAFSPDGEFLVILSDDYFARIYSVSDFSKHCDLKLEEAREEFVSASFSSDQKEIATITHSFGFHTRLWNADTCSPLANDRELDPILGSAAAASFSPTEPYLALVTRDGTVRFLHKTVSGWKEVPDSALGPYPGANALPNSSDLPPPAVAWSGSGKYFALAGGDNVVRVGSLGSPRVIGLKGHSKPVTSIDFSPINESVLVTTSEDHTARVWRLSPGGEGVLESVVLRGHTDKVHSAVFSPNGEMIITAADDTTIRLWKSEFSFHKLPSTKVVPIAASFSPDGKEIWAANGSTTWTFSANTLMLEKEALLQSFKTLSELALPGGLHYRENEEGDLKTLLTRTLGKVQLAGSGRFTSGRITLFSSNGALVFHDGEEFEDNGKKKDEVEVWAVGGQKLELGHHRPHESFRAIGLSDDGSTVAWYSPEDNEVVFTRKGWKSPTYTIKDEKTAEIVRFNGDGKTLAITLEDDNILLVDVESATLVANLRGHSGKVSAIAFSTDYRYLASISKDETLRIWSIGAGVEVAVKDLSGLGDVLTELSFSPDGLSLLLMGERDLYLWRCSACGSLTRLLDTVRQHIDRKELRALTEAEQKRYGIERRKTP